MKTLLNLLSYPRAIFVLLFDVIHTIGLSIVVLIMTMVLQIRKQSYINPIVHSLWPKPMTWLPGLSVIVRGSELVQGSKKGFLILFNHSSYMDIPVLFGYFPRSFRFGSKVELFKVPFFGKAMAACGTLPIDRRNRSQVMKIYDQAIARVENGESFALAPEGTRQSEAKLGKFKRGPFEFAINAQMDLVPVVLVGTFEAMPRNTFFTNAGRWHRHVIMQITPPISTAGLTLENVDDLQARTFAQMNAVFEKTHAELEKLDS